MVSRKDHKGAFTLIELLVVIAIIAVLMSILMPALSAVKKQAKGVQCVNNVKNLSLAWFMYKDDNDTKLVRGETGTAQNPNWIADRITSFSPDAMEQEKEGIRQGLLFPYVGKSVESYRCPADMRTLSADLPTFRTYSITGGMYGVAKAGAWEIVPHTTYSTIKTPAKKVVFLAEADPRGMNMGSWVMHPRSRGWVDPFAIWHTKNRSTLGFADGHGEMHRWQSADLAKWCTALWEAPGTFQFYRTPASEEEWSDFQWMVERYPYRRLQ
ncbi:MAG: type II secretion system GspH family protein [Phycisphaerae bacterium]|nr:type II secretion system GspH family protein [Phycisphaerae bacterium]